jgi:hypothetical protein
MSVISVQIYGTEVKPGVSLDDYIGMKAAAHGKPITISIREHNNIATSHYTLEQAQVIAEKIAAMRGMTMISNSDLALLKRAAIVGAQVAELNTGNGVRGRFPKSLQNATGVDFEAVSKFCRFAAEGA